MFSQAKVVYSRDDSVHEFTANIQKMGRDDIALSFFQQASGLIYNMEKIEKWLTVKDDLLYAQLWILQSAYTYANKLLVLDGKPPSREAVLKVMAYAPQFIAPIYQRPMQGPMTRDEVFEVLNLYRKFLEDNLDMNYKLTCSCQVSWCIIKFM